MAFHWSLSDSKSSQVSWTLLDILGVFNNAVVVSWNRKVDNFANSSFFLLIIIKSGLLAEIR